MIDQKKVLTSRKDIASSGVSCFTIYSTQEAHSHHAGMERVQQILGISLSPEEIMEPFCFIWDQSRQISLIYF